MPASPSDEFHQGLVTGRHLSALDVAIDATAALIALVIVGLISSRWPCTRAK